MELTTQTGPERTSVVSLPREGMAVAEEAAGGAGVGQGGGPDDAGRAYFDRAAAGPAHVGGDPAGADRVDQDVIAAEFGGEHAGEGVEGDLRRGIGRGPAAHAGQRGGLA